jgi:hypothetical protein
MYTLRSEAGETDSFIFMKSLRSPIQSGDGIHTVHVSQNKIWSGAANEKTTGNADKFVPDPSTLAILHYFYGRYEKKSSIVA